MQPYFKEVCIRAAVVASKQARVGRKLGGDTAAALLEEHGDKSRTAGSCEIFCSGFCKVGSVWYLWVEKRI